MRRSHLYDDVLKIFSDERIKCEYPLDIKFEDERAVDFGGVSSQDFGKKHTGRFLMAVVF